MIKAIIFDLDLTLTNRQYSIYQCFKEFVLKHFPTLDWMEQEAIIQRMMLLDGFGTIYKGYNAEKIAELYHLDYEMIKDDFLKLSDKMAPFTILDDGALEVIQTLKKDYQLAIITNGPHAAQACKIDTVGICDYFDEILIAGEVDLWKPDPAVYLLAAERLNVKAEECLFVGDILFNDLLGAHRAKMHYVLINNHRKWHYDERVPYINHLKDLIPYIKEHYGNPL